MAGSKSDYLENKFLDHVYGNTAYTAPANVYVGLFTAVSADGTYTEVTNAGAYARVNTTNNTTNWPNASSGVKQNGTALNFPTATADWANGSTYVVGWGTFDSATIGGGNLLHWGEFVSSTQYAFTADATTDVLTAPGSSYTNGQMVKVWAAPNTGATIPTGLSQGTTYYVVNVSGNTFKLSATSGGSAIDITAAGAGIVALDLKQNVVNGNTASIASGALTITED